jgi:hypothetical protein
MKYKILTTNRYRWGEGWQYGDIVEMDNDSSAVPFQNREIEVFNEQVEVTVESGGDNSPVNIDQPIITELKCKICDKVCKNELGLKSHMRSHK